MPRPVLSLLGFMDKQQATTYLQKWVILPEPDRLPLGNYISSLRGSYSLGERCLSHLLHDDKRNCHSTISA